MPSPPAIRLDIIVLDTDDPARDSTFWAALLGGERHTDDPDWHEVTWAGTTIALQRAPGHVPPDWPDGAPMQVHLDFVVTDVLGAHEHALAVGARHLAREPAGASEKGFVVYADPAGHPFCCAGASEARFMHPVSSAQRSLDEHPLAHVRLDRGSAYRHRDQLGSPAEGRSGAHLRGVPATGGRPSRSPTLSRGDDDGVRHTARHDAADTGPTGRLHRRPSQGRAACAPCRLGAPGDGRGAGGPTPGQGAVGP